VTDESGTVVYSAAHDPYGGIQQTWVNTYDPTPKFSGKERDGESGLDYFGARYYDRAQYRFISADPLVNVDLSVRNPQRWHLYSYCMNNPMSFVDPNGEDLIPFALPAAGGKTLFTYVDSAFASKVTEFIRLCNELGVNVTFDNAYRTQSTQDRIRKSNNNAARFSLHSVGWAVDINMNSLTSYDFGLVELAAWALDLRSGTEFNDSGHYDQSPPNWNSGSAAQQTLERVLQIYKAYEQFMSYNAYELDPMGLYMLYGVFSASAAEKVVMDAIDSALKAIKQ
jgi:RHS repeat-associated protein